MVAGAGFAPAVFGLWAQRDTSSPPRNVGASAGSSENYKEGAIFNSVTVRQRLEYTKVWVMWATILGFEIWF